MRKAKVLLMSFVCVAALAVSALGADGNLSEQQPERGRLL